MPRTSVPTSRHVDGVHDVGGADENMVMHSSGHHVSAATGGEDADGYRSGQKQKALR